MNAVARARRVNGGLTLLALVALGLVLLTGRLPSRVELELRQRHVLSLFRETEIERLAIARAGERAVVVRAAPLPPEATAAKAGSPEEEPESDAPHDEPAAAEAVVDGVPPDSWRLLEPVETDADSTAVASLIGSLRYATWVRRLDSDEAGALAFAADALTLEVEMASASYRLRLGGDSVTPAGSKYLEVTETRHTPGASPQRHVVVIKDTLVTELDRSLQSFRGRQIAPYSRRSVKSLTLSGAGGERRLERRGDDLHLIVESGEVRAERAALERLFLGFARMQAEPFLSLAEAEQALASGPRVDVSLTPSDASKPPARLVVGGRCPGREHKAVALRESPDPLAGCVDDSVLEVLSVPGAALIDRGLFSLNLDELDRLYIAEGEQRLELARKGDGFVLTAPREAELDHDAVSDRLTMLLAVRGERVLPVIPPLSEDTAAIVVRASSAAASDDKATEQVLYVSAPRPDGSVDVLRLADGATLRIGPEQRLLVSADTGLLKSLVVFEYATTQIKSLEVRTPQLAQGFTRRESGDLTLTSPPGFDIDGGLAVDLIDRVRALTALRWVTDRTTAAFGLKSPRATLRLHVDVDGRDVERTLTLGDRTAGGFYASVDRDPGVFVVAPALERALATWLIDRSLFGVRRSEIERILVDGGSLGQLSLMRVAGQLVGEGRTSLDPARIEELVDALETLRPEAAVHLGPARRGEGLERPLLRVSVERSAAAGALPTLSFSVGSRDTFNAASVYYARTSAAVATFALPRDQVQRLLDLF